LTRSARGLVVEPIGQMPVAPGCGRVLVVTAQANAGIRLSRLLHEAGHHACRAGSATEATALMRDATFNAVMLDRHLPNHGAAAMLRRLSNQDGTTGLPVVVFGQHHALEDATWACARGSGLGHALLELVEREWRGFIV
jgi:DNA-binding NtrC family response regulator